MPDPDGISDDHKIELLAEVVLHVLVADGRDGMTTENVARECERDADHEADRQEVEAALKVVVDGDLAVHEADGAWRPTRAAVRAAELSF
jgi:hypothetical protein